MIIFLFIRGWAKRICLLFLLLLPFAILAAPPIQGGALRGIDAKDARLKLISAAESFLGTPYRYSGLNRNGIDCSGLVYMSFREALHTTIPRSSHGIYNWAEKISTNELQPGDLVFFITSGRNVSHLGIYTGGGRFIHSASEGPRTGVIYSRLDEAYWKRTYHGAGRALPGTAEAANAVNANNTAGTANTINAVNTAGVAAAANAAAYPEIPNSGQNSRVSGASAGLTWATDTGLFTGVGAAWTWGGLAEGSPSVFRGFTSMVTMGYKWPVLRLGFELRTELDRSLGVFRLPVTLSIGTNYFQVFAGPALTFGNPGLSLSDGKRQYAGGGKWNLELGTSVSLPLWKIYSGSLSLYGEAAFQYYRRSDGSSFNIKHDVPANFHFSTGLRYMWLL